MNRAALAPILLSACVVALLALQVATSNRLAKLQDQVAKLEERPAMGGAGGGDTAAASGGSVQPGSSSSAGKAGVAPGETPSGPGSVAGLATPEHAEGEAPSPVKLRKRTGEALSEEDVEALIEKKLAARDKKNPLASLMNFEDPMTVMDRELKLSPIQKSRIQEHMKERDDATMDLWQSEEARKDWRGIQEKSDALRKTCDESIKRELDLAQQEKYEELKKSGKLLDFGGGGRSVVIGGFSEGDENGTEGVSPGK